MGVLPDAAILCINTIDPEDFVRQSIQCIESIGKTKVIALAFSDKRKMLTKVMGQEVVSNIPMNEEEIKVTSEKLEKMYGLPCMDVVGNAGKKRLAEMVEKYLEA